MAVLFEKSVEVWHVVENVEIKSDLAVVHYCSKL